jgi:hypothetical protein
MEEAMQSISLEDEDSELYGTPPSSPVRRVRIQSTKTNRGTFVVLSEDEEEEENRPVASTTPAPAGRAKAQPRSLARSGAKKVVRQVLHLKPRVEELKSCHLTPKSSFLVSEWTNEFGKEDGILSKHAEPEVNVEILLKRVKSVYNLFTASFDRVSGIYIGKSCNMRVRFNHHQRSKKKSDESLAMIGVALFTDEDVPDQDQRRWKMKSDQLAMNYERLLLQAVVDSGLPIFEDSEEVGGGGRSSGHMTKQVAVYMLVSIANNEE